MIFLLVSKFKVIGMLLNVVHGYIKSNNTTKNLHTSDKSDGLDDD